MSWPTWVTAIMWIAWFKCAVAARVQPVPLTVGAGRFDRCGAVVAGELGAGAEPADVVDVAEHDRGDDRTDTVQLGERRARGGDGVADALLDRVELGVEAAHVGEVLARRVVCVRRRRGRRPTSMRSRNSAP